MAEGVLAPPSGKADSLAAQEPGITRPAAEELQESSARGAAQSLTNAGGPSSTLHSNGLPSRASQDAWPVAFLKQNSQGLSLKLRPTAGYGVAQAGKEPALHSGHKLLAAPRGGLGRLDGLQTARHGPRPGPERGSEEYASPLHEQVLGKEVWARMRTEGSDGDDLYAPEDELSPRSRGKRGTGSRHGDLSGVLVTGSSHLRGDLSPGLRQEGE